MKINKSVIRLCVLTVFGLIAASCSQSELDLSAQDKGKTADAGTIITAEATLDTHIQEMVSAGKMQTSQNIGQTPETRAEITYDAQGNLTYSWAQGKSIPLYIYITDGTRHETLTATVDMKVVSSRKARFTFTVPEGYDLSRLKGRQQPAKRVMPITAPGHPAWIAKAM